MSHTVDLEHDIGEILLTEAADRRQGRGARPPHQRGLRRPQPDARLGAQGLAAVHGRPDAPDLAAAPDRPHGGQLLRRHGDRVVRPRPDHQGPVGQHRRRGRPAGRGHHRHRPDAQLPRPLPARQEPGLAQDLHAARQAGAAPRRHPGGLRRASRSPTSSWSATGSTTASATATCASWASCAPRSTRRTSSRWSIVVRSGTAAAWRSSARSS